MANNLHISYDLHKPDKNDAAVMAKIEALGDWAKINSSYWYVNSRSTAAEACNTLWQAMDTGDSVYVVDATNNAVAWQNINEDTAGFIRDTWAE